MKNILNRTTSSKELMEELMYWYLQPQYEAEEAQEAEEAARLEREAEMAKTHWLVGDANSTSYEVFVAGQMEAVKEVASLCACGGHGYVISAPCSFDRAVFNRMVDLYEDIVRSKGY